MVNPFCNSSDVEILREAFPTLNISVIEDNLIVANGDVNRAFELLLALTDPAHSSTNGPPLPNRRTTHSGFPTCSPPGMMIPPIPAVPNPFMTAKPLTVREELAQWRQDLRTQSSRRASNNSNRNPTSNASFSNVFKSNSSRSSLQEHVGSNDTRNHYVSSTHSVPQINFQRPLMPSSISTGNISNNRMYSNSSPNVNYHAHSRSISNPSSATLSPPVLPRRRQSSNSLSNNSTNPFLPGATPTTRRPVPDIPPTNPNHREFSTTSENDTATFNPFEEPELPPPAYNEIQRDAIVNLAP